MSGTTKIVTGQVEMKEAVVRCVQTVAGTTQITLLKKTYKEINFWRFRKKIIDLKMYAAPCLLLTLNKSTTKCDSLQQKVPYVASTSGCFTDIITQLLINIQTTSTLI